MNQPINDGGPAFPAQDWQAKGNHHPGMTLRDYFAAAALQGLMANPECNKTWDESDVAKFCYGMADAMLKAREAKP